MKRFAQAVTLLAAFALVLACPRAFGEDHPEQQQNESDSSRKVVNRVVPIYPSLARGMNVRGVVRIEALVAPNGTVKSVDAKGGHPLLIQAAQSAVQKWRWQTAQHESKEVVEIKFDPDK